MTARSPQVGTPSGMRELNQHAVLDLLRSSGAATRPAIAKHTGLSKPTVGQALLDLESHGLVRTAGSSNTGPGRSAVLYEADPSAGHVLGIDIGRERIRSAVADLAGTVVARRDERNRARSGRALVAAVRRCAEAVCAEAGLGLTEVVTTVVGSPGVATSESRTVRLAPNLPGWGRKGLLDELEDALGAGLVVENDSNLCAVGEHRAGAARDHDTFVCLTVGTGIGMGVILNGTLYRGAHGAAGEVGYLPYGWPAPGIATDAPPQGMLEAAAGAHSVVGIAAERGLDARTAREVFAQAHAGDVRAVAAVEEEAARLAFVVGSAAAVLDPGLVVLGGGVGTNTDLLAEPLRRNLARITPHAPPVVAGELGERAVLTGAVATGLRTAQDVVFDRACGAGRGHEG